MGAKLARRQGHDDEGMMRHSVLLVGLLAWTAGCGSSFSDGSPSTGGAPPGTGGQGAPQTGGAPPGGVPATGGAVGGVTPGGNSGGTASGGASIGGTSITGGATFTGSATTGGISATGGLSADSTPSLGTGGVPGSTTTGGAGTGGVPSSATTGGVSGTGGASAGGTSGGESGGSSAGGTSSGSGGAGNGGHDAGGGGGEPTGAGAGGQTGVAGQAGSQTGGADGGLVSSCVGDVVPTANPASGGPFQVAADKNVGPLAGDLPDPIYGDEQQRFNVYRPSNLADSGYCHPILIWANGYTDNPEPNPPLCVVDSGANKWCGQYLPMMNHLASHGFVVVASLSTATGRGDPLPTIVGLDWILEQAEDPSSQYYHRLDTANIGQLGHSFGGMSTCMSASEPRYKALATICGTAALSGVHTPMLFFCGGRDSTVGCDGVKDVFRSVTDQPAFFLNERDSDHGSWVYQGPGGVSLSAAAAWFRVHLMGDTENRKYFYGPNCTFCSDNRVEAEQNSLMSQ